MSPAIVRIAGGILLFNLLAWGGLMLARILEGNVALAVFDGILLIGTALVSAIFIYYLNLNRKGPRRPSR